MTKYKVHITYQYTQTCYVEAESEQEAIDIALQSDVGVNCDDSVLDWEVGEVK